MLYKFGCLQNFQRNVINFKYCFPITCKLNVCDWPLVSHCRQWDLKGQELYTKASYQHGLDSDLGISLYPFAVHFINALISMTLAVCILFFIISGCKNIFVNFFLEWNNKDTHYYFPESNDRGHTVSIQLSTFLGSAVNFNFTITRDRDFIFGMHTQLMTPFQKTPRSMTLTLTLLLKIAFLDFVATRYIALYKYILFTLQNVCLCYYFILHSTLLRRKHLKDQFSCIFR